VPTAAAAEVLVITDEVRPVPGRIEGDRITLDAADLEAAVGWALRPQGLCRGDVCVPVANVSRLSAVDGRLDLFTVAHALGRGCVVDADAGIAALSEDPAARHDALAGQVAPDFTLPDLDGEPHSLSDWRGRKRLLVTFASWCGCRYDLPGWQALHDELSGDGFTAIPVAIDEDPEDVRPFTEGIDLPVLVDRQHLLTERYAISNVPTVLWIDEDDRIVRPNGVAFGTDLFVDFTGVPAGPHLDMVRRWVRDGEAPADGDDARAAVEDLSNDELLARLHFRVAAAARRRGDDGLGDEETARRHFDAAVALAPFDFTVRRAAMPLTGRDPFGQEFFDWYQEWQEAGMPYHGLMAPKQVPSSD
jgi:peroxiredoxin